MVCEHGEGQPAERMENSLWRQHIPGNRDERRRTIKPQGMKERHRALPSDDACPVTLGCCSARLPLFFKPESSAAVIMWDRRSSALGLFKSFSTASERCNHNLREETSHWPSLKSFSIKKNQKKTVYSLVSDIRYCSELINDLTVD